MFIHFWQRETERDRERARVSQGGAERERDTESEAGSRLRAVSTEPDVGLELMSHEIMTWAKVGHWTDWVIQVPRTVPILNISYLRGAWVAQSVKRPTLAQVMISGFVSSSPASGSVLTAQSLEPVSESVSPLSVLFMLCLSLSQK